MTELDKESLREREKESEREIGQKETIGEISEGSKTKEKDSETDRERVGEREVTELDQESLREREKKNGGEIG